MLPLLFLEPFQLKLGFKKNKVLPSSFPICLAKASPS